MALPPAQAQALTPAQQAIMRYRTDPVAWVREVLQIEPQEWQQEALLSVVNTDKISIRSGHGVGKSLTIGCIALWWLSTRYPAKVACTAPSAHQLEDVLWAEIRMLIRRMPKAMQDQFVVKTDKIELAKGGSESFIVARTARKENPEALQGFHCLAEDHEILTRRGWLSIDELHEWDWVLSAPPNDGPAEWMPVTAVHRYPFVGELNVHDSRSISFAVTDGHRFVNKYNPAMARWRITPLAEVKAQMMVRQSVDWKGRDFEVPEPFAALGFDQKRFAQFIGFWIAEGGLRQHTPSGLFYDVILYQMKADGRAFVETLLDGINVRRVGEEFVFSSRAAAEWLLQNVGRYQHERRIPRDLLDAPPDILWAMLDAMMLGDGTKRADGSYGQYYSNSVELMDDVQELLLKLGRAATIGVNMAAGTKRTINGVDTQANYDTLVTSVRKSCTNAMVKRSTIRRVPYSGRVWCISTPYETFFTRRNGRVFLSGNSSNMMFLLDEASGIDDEIFVVSEGALSTPGSKVVMTGNPTRTSGYFYDSHNKMRHRWHTMRVGSDTATTVSKTFVEDMARRYGQDSNIYRVRVLGEFPTSEDDAVIPLHLCEAATRREVERVPDARLIWGLDVARFGSDLSCLCKRWGNHLIEPTKTWQGKDTMTLAGIILMEYREAVHKPDAIVVDVIGVGAGVLDRLVDLNLPAIGCNVAESAAVSERFLRLRDELWFGVRDWLARMDCKMVDDDELIAELTNVKYKVTPSGKLKVESKDEMRARGVASPNRADALCLSFAASDLRATHFAAYMPESFDDG